MFFEDGTVSLGFEVNRGHLTNPYLKILKRMNLEMVPPRSILADALAAVGLKGRMETAQCCKSEFLSSGYHYVCGPQENYQVL